MSTLGSVTNCERHIKRLLTSSISFDDLLKDLFGASMPDMTTG